MMDGLMSLEGLDAILGEIDRRDGEYRLNAFHLDLRRALVFHVDTIDFMRPRRNPVMQAVRPSGYTDTPKPISKRKARRLRGKARP